MTIFRPPFGTLDREKRRLINQLGYSMGSWNVDTDDWRMKGDNATFATFLKRMADAQTEGSAIVLMHDYAISLKVLNRILDYFQERNYQFVTMKTCAELCAAAQAVNGVCQTKAYVFPGTF